MRNCVITHISYWHRSTGCRRSTGSDHKCPEEDCLPERICEWSCLRHHGSIFRRRGVNQCLSAVRFLLQFFSDTHRRWDQDWCSSVRGPNCNDPKKMFWNSQTRRPKAERQPIDTCRDILMFSFQTYSKLVERIRNPLSNILNLWVCWRMHRNLVNNVRWTFRGTTRSHTQHSFTHH